MRRYLILIGLLAAVFATGGVLAGDAEALEPGETVTFAVPAAGPQPDVSNNRTVALVFRGGMIASTDVTGCGPPGATRPVQDAVALYPDGGSAQITGVIITSQADPVRPGTRVGNLTFVAFCAVAGTPYVLYEGTVQ